MQSRKKIGKTEFSTRPLGYVSDAARSADLIEVTFHGKDQTTLVSTPRARRMAHAEQIVDGLLALAERGADPNEYRDFIEAVGLTEQGDSADGAATQGVSTMA